MLPLSRQIFYLFFCSTKIGEFSDISKCFDNFVSQTLGVLTRIYAAELRQDKSRLELYAIRFDGNNKEAQSHKDRRPYGNRYRCAYRWRFMDAGGPDVTNDKQGMRLVVQSRWIGNANVTIRDIMDDKWWGECSDSNPLYRTDCYRVLPCVGYPFPKGGAT